MPRQSMPARTYPMTEPDGRVIDRHANGLLVATDPTTGERWYVTECCHASAKGSSNSPTGVCCRCCYAEADPSLGGIVPRDGHYAHEGDEGCRGDACDSLLLTPSLGVRFCECSCHAKGAQPIPGAPDGDADAAPVGTVFVVEIPDAPALDPRPIPALPKGGLWASNGGTITCVAHGGGYLASAIAARPKARRHTTPLDVWTKYTAATWRAEVEGFRAAGLSDPACESC